MKLISVNITPKQIIKMDELSRTTGEGYAFKKLKELGWAKDLLCPSFEKWLELLTPKQRIELYIAYFKDQNL